MVSDNRDSFFPGVAGNFLYIKIGIRTGIVERLRTAPVFPTFIPAFIHHCFDVVGRCKVDVPLCVLCCGTVTIIYHPTFHSQMHSPPDTYIFHRTYPVGSFQRTRFVQIQNKTGVDKPDCFRGNLYGTPRCLKASSVEAGFYTVRPGSQFGFKIAVSRILQGHLRKIGQCSFMDAGI